MSHQVVGADLSLAATGVATSGGLFTVAISPGLRTTSARLWRFLTIIGGVWNRIEDDNAVIVVEGPSYRSSGSATHDLAGLWWLFVDRCQDWGWNTVVVPPATLKRFATGKGTATKADMRMALYQRAGLDIRDDNQVDAFFLRQIGLHLLEDPDAIKLPQTHLAALDKIDWSGR